MTARTSVARWLMLLVALAGLMAMHGLSDHGVGGPVPLDHPPAATGAMTDMPAPPGDEEPAGGHGGHEGLLVGLCLAVLAAVLLLSAVVRRGRPIRASRTWLDGLAVAVRARARGPSTPDLRQLSVLRC